MAKELKAALNFRGLENLANDSEQSVLALKIEESDTDLKFDCAFSSRNTSLEFIVAPKGR